jgi:oligopeptide/dipeptide ABC transporter ATP-binding protein
MGVVEHISDRVAVMYLGKIVESADRLMMFRDPQHPYTQALFSAIPIPDASQRRRRIILQGDVPSPLFPPRGCRFNPRCQLRAQLGGPSLCVEREPALSDVSATQAVACHFRGPAAAANLASIGSRPPADPAHQSAT